MYNSFLTWINEYYDMAVWTLIFYELFNKQYTSDNVNKVKCYGMKGNETMVYLYISAKYTSYKNLPPKMLYKKV